MMPAFITDPNPEIYLSDNYLVVDFETDTSGGGYGHARYPDNHLLLSCVRTGPGHPRYRDGVTPEWGNELEQSTLALLLDSADFLVAHHAKYELGWLKRCGLDLRKILVFDTQIAEWHLFGNLAMASEHTGRGHALALDACCRRRGMPIKDPVVDTLISHDINPVRIPRPWLQARCKQDVESTEQVFLDQRKILHRRGMLPLVYTACLLTPVLADIEQEGMGLDAVKVEAFYDDHCKQLAALEAEMKEMTGGINWRSTKQAGEFIYDKLGFKEICGRDGTPKRTAGGKRATDQKTLALLDARTEPQKSFVQLRKRIGRVGSALSKALDFYVGICREQGGSFFADLNQTRTSTGRLSSSGVAVAFAMFDGDSKTAQFQNQPRAFKELFKAKRPGYKIADPDGAALEFRVAGMLSGDKQIKHDILTGHDPHLFTASAMFGVPMDEVETEGANSQRQQTKPTTFKPLYGGSKGTAKEEKYFKAFRERYSGLARVQEDWVAEVLFSKRLITTWGMRYYFPRAKKSFSGYVNCTAAVYNYPVQAFATKEIMPIAVTHLWHRIGEAGRDEEMRIVNFVHDSAPTEVEEGYGDEYRDLVRQSFTTDVYRYLEKVYPAVDLNGIPLGFGLKIGDHWGKGSEEKWNVYEDGREEKLSK